MMDIVSTGLGEGDARKCQTCQARGLRYVTDLSVSWQVMQQVQSEGGRNKFKSNCYHTLKLFQNLYSWRIYHRLWGTFRMNGKPEFAEGAEFSPARLDAWILVAVECFLERETWCGHRQNISARIFGRIVEQTVGQIILKIHGFVKWWELEEVKVTTESGESRAREDVLLDIKRNVTGVLKLTR